MKKFKLTGTLISEVNEVKIMTDTYQLSGEVPYTESYAITEEEKKLLRRHYHPMCTGGITEVAKSDHNDVIRAYRKQKEDV